MEFLLQLLDFGLSDVGVQSFLHFLLELILPLPKQYLPFALNNLVHKVCLLLPNDVNVVFELGCLVLHLLELLDELTLQIDVLIL